MDGGGKCGVWRAGGCSPCCEALFGGLGQLVLVCKGVVV